MHNLLVFLATADPSPGGELREGLDPEAVTPGTLGFLATLFVVVVTFFLIRDMTKRVRRVRYREQVQENAARADAEAAEPRRHTDADGGTPPDDGGTTAPGHGGTPADDGGTTPDDGGTPSENDGGTTAPGHGWASGPDSNRRK